MTSSGYIMLHRRLLDHPLFRRPGFILLWTWCLLRTQYKDETVTYRGVTVHLKRGQFIFGRLLAVKETGLSDKQIRGLIVLLQRDGMISPVEIGGASKRASRFSIFLVENWEDYQNLGPAKGPTRGPQKGHQKGLQVPVDKSKNGASTGASKRASYLKEIRNKEEGVFFSYEEVLATMLEENITMDDFERLENGMWKRK